MCFTCNRPPQAWTRRYGGGLPMWGIDLLEWWGLPHHVVIIICVDLIVDILRFKCSWEALFYPILSTGTRRNIGVRGDELICTPKRTTKGGVQGSRPTTWTQNRGRVNPHVLCGECVLWRRDITWWWLGHNSNALNLCGQI